MQSRLHTRRVPPPPRRARTCSTTQRAPCAAASSAASAAMSSGPRSSAGVVMRSRASVNADTSADTRATSQCGHTNSGREAGGVLSA
eukprot:352890-Chlamydomonas_euryale.AAC.1